MDYSNLAHLSDLSSHTVKAHIEAMSIAHAVFLVPPFQGGGHREITRRPKCYAFDTGFVTFIRGWESIGGRSGSPVGARGSRFPACRC